MNKNLFGNKQLKIVRHVGELNQVEVEGEKVKREESIYIQDIGLVKCVPMDNHFVFRKVFKNRGWSLWCTCGSPAAIFNYDAYKEQGGNQGAMICCMAYTGAVPGLPAGAHADGSH